MILVNHLTFAYKNSQDNIFEDISVEIPGGKIIGLIGPNGAGKTTFFNLLMGSLKPQIGDIFISVKENERIILVQNLSLPYLAKIEELMECIFSLNDLKVKMNKEKFLDSLSKRESERFKKIKKRRFGQCSMGEKKWFTAIFTLFLPKRLYLLDEPTVGIDPEYRHLIWEKIKTVKMKDRAIIVSSHLLDEMDRHVDEFFFISSGKFKHFASIGHFMEYFGATDPDEAFALASQ